MNRSLLLWLTAAVVSLALLGGPPLVLAQEQAPAAEAPAAAPAESAPAAEQSEDPDYQGQLDTLWTLLAAFLVFFMQAGFAMVEVGFTRAKNACNILMKNLIDFSVGSLSFWAIGFTLMFGATIGGFIGWDANYLFFDGAKAAAAKGDTTIGFAWAFLLFQTVFCATAATIVSGAVAERTKFVGYLCYSVAITALVYPIFGAWAWGSLWAGSGWLEGLGFHDFAGSTVVHSIGGWCALAGALVIGARRGKYVNGKVMPIPGHNIPLAGLGVFILWLGWFGFNPGSTTAVGLGEGSFTQIAVVTNLAAAAGAIGAMVVSWIMFKKPDPSFALNGALAGLVTITAGCDVLSGGAAVLAGLIGGAIVVPSVVFFDRLRIDDPVGAISVHGVCGAWGTLATGLFSPDVAIWPQVVGIVAGFAWAFPASLVIFLAIKYTVGLRVDEQEELEGLDITEHGLHAYPPGFVYDTVHGSPVGTGSAGVITASPAPQASSS